jgi:hypothetical protein
MIAITYTTKEREFTGEWKYIGNGESIPQFSDKDVKHRICFSRDNSEYSRCVEYVKSNEDDLLNAKIHVIPDTENAWKELI